MIKIDARGLECPKPVIMTKKALEEADEISIMVDNDVARDNVERFGRNAGCKITIIENEEGIEMFLTKDSKATSDFNEDDVIVLVKSNVFGDGDPKLGVLLMKSFFISLLEGDIKVKALIFMNKGVELTTINEDMVEVLKAFENEGTEVLSCGTCLDFYGLKADLKTGKITNMYSSVELMTYHSSKVITI